jgi:hypothetical protein
VGDLNLSFILDVTTDDPAGDFNMGLVVGNSFLAPPLGPNADFTENGTVQTSDLPLWRSNFGKLGSVHAEGDANNDNLTNGTDFLLWQRQLGMSFPAVGASAAVPEPSTLALLEASLAVASGLSRKRHRDCGNSAPRFLSR